MSIFKFELIKQQLTADPWTHMGPQRINMRGFVKTYVSMSVSLYVCIFLYVYLSVCLYVCMSEYFCMSLCLTHFGIYLSEVIFESISVYCLVQNRNIELEQVFSLREVGRQGGREVGIKLRNKMSKLDFGPICQNAAQLMWCGVFASSGFIFIFQANIFSFHS